MDANSDIDTLLNQFSEGRLSAIDLRNRLGGVTYGDLFRMIAVRRLPLPDGGPDREADVSKAKAWLFPPRDAPHAV